MRVALLTNFIAPYRLPLLEALRDRVGELRIFVSTPMESDRDWAVDWGSLDVVVQRNLTLHRSFRDPLGYRRGLQIHVPYDNNVNRFLGRKMLSEFEMRVLFQMSTNDSASLCDDPKASNLGLHRALYYNEQEGWLETFRPYALPAGERIDEVSGKLTRDAMAK